MKITRFIRSVVSGFLVSACASALTSEPGAFSADTQNFGIRLFLVPNAKEFTEMWSQAETPRITVFTQVVMKQEFAAVILYWGGTPDEKGNCDIVIRTHVTQASKTLTCGPAMPLCSDHAPPPAGILALGDFIVDLVATGEPANLLVHVEATDKNGGETLLVSAPIEVVR